MQYPLYPPPLDLTVNSSGAVPAPANHQSAVQAQFEPPDPSEGGGRGESGMDVHQLFQVLIFKNPVRHKAQFFIMLFFTGFAATETSYATRHQPADN